jgi:hypothetical protein
MKWENQRSYNRKGTLCERYVKRIIEFRQEWSEICELDYKDWSSSKKWNILMSGVMNYGSFWMQSSTVSSGTRVWTAERTSKENDNIYVELLFYILFNELCVESISLRGVFVLSWMMMSDDEGDVLKIITW